MRITAQQLRYRCRFIKYHENRRLITKLDELAADMVNKGIKIKISDRWRI